MALNVHLGNRNVKKQNFLTLSSYAAIRSNKSAYEPKSPLIILSGVILFPQQGHGNSPGVPYSFTPHLQADVKPPLAWKLGFSALLPFGTIGLKLRSA